MPENDKTFTQDEVNRIVTERLARQQAKFDSSIKEISSSAIKSYLAERGIDDDGLDKLISANVDEKEAKIKQLTAQNKKLQSDLESASSVLKVKSAKLDRKTKRDALFSEVGGKCTQEQQKVLWALMKDELSVGENDDVLVVGDDGQPTGEPLSKRVETVLSKYNFLNAPPEPQERKPDGVPAYSGNVKPNKKERIRVPYDEASMNRAARIKARIAEAGGEF